MKGRLIVVLDVGKTLAKASLWTRDGKQLAKASRPNVSQETGPYRALDAQGIENWLVDVLAGFKTFGRISAIVPVAHGAAAVVLRDGTLALPPMDYEGKIPDPVRQSYLDQRGQFSETGSPAMNDGLNLGLQLHYMEHLFPGLFEGDATILPWAQYWAWRLSGVAASEVSGFGPHTDLWAPADGKPSKLAERRGWAKRFAPLRHASDALGQLSLEWSSRTGLPADTMVLTGLHDSNAALHAARAIPEIGDNDATIVSTGTWFVSMRSSAVDDSVLATLREDRGCVVNVDVNNRPVPTALFMGGREIGILTGEHGLRVDAPAEQMAITGEVGTCLDNDIMILPCFVPDTGPFPKHRGRWINRPQNPFAAAAAVSLYAALMTDAALNLIGTRETILIDGRFANAEAFVRALATLRAHDNIYVGSAENDLAVGALRLVSLGLKSLNRLKRVDPLAVSLANYREQWLERGIM